MQLPAQQRDCFPSEYKLYYLPYYMTSFFFTWWNLFYVANIVEMNVNFSCSNLKLIVYNLQALGFPMPKFGHVSLILAPDRSKLSKRHGATSVGQVNFVLPETLLCSFLFSLNHINIFNRYLIYSTTIKLCSWLRSVQRDGAFTSSDG